MKKTVTIKASSAVFVGGLTLFTGTRKLTLNVGDVRMAILQNAIVTEEVDGKVIRLTLENYDKDNSSPEIPPAKPDSLTDGDLTVTYNSITNNKELNVGEEMEVYTFGSTSDLKGKGKTVTGLTESTKYDVYVRATKTRGNLSTLSDKLTVTTKVAPPAKPAALVIGDLQIQPTQIKCTKSLPQDQTMVVYPKGNTSTAKGEGTTVTGLTENTEYDVYVKATKGDLTTLSDKLTVRTTIALPAKPAALVIGDLQIQPTQIKCTKALASGQTMVVYPLNNNSDPIGEGTTVTGLTENTEYDVYVKATKGELHTLSDKLTVRTTIALPAKPDALVEGNLEIQSTQIKCTKSLPQGQTMVVYPLGDTSTAKGEGTTVTGLTENTQYDVYVKATKGDLITLSDKLTVRTPYTKPAKPAALVIGDLQVQSTQIKCTKSLASGQTMVVYPRGNTSTPKGEGTTVTGLTENTQYDVYVKATNGNLHTLSDKLEVTTPYTKPAKPAALTTGDLTVADTTITLNKSLDANQKMVVYTLGSTTDLKGEGTTVSGLTAETQYDVYVKATNGNQHTLSDKLTVTTTATVSQP